MPPTNRRPRTVDTSMHFCPHLNCDYRGWLGLNNLRANGHPSGGPWRQFHCTACDGYFPEHHGTIFHGKFEGKEWVQLYTGKKNDFVFQQNMISWMQYLRNKLHPLGVRVSANIKATTASSEVILNVIDAVDMWVDETGFCHRGANITGEAWKKAFLFLRKVSPTKAYVSINQVKGLVPQAAPEQIEWVIANYLLSRGPQSLLALTGYEKTTVYHSFDYRKELDIVIGEPSAEPVEINNGAWIRTYTNGLALVNPSASQTVIVKLPEGKWKTLKGNSAEGEISMKPASGLVLTKLGLAMMLLHGMTL